VSSDLFARIDKLELLYQCPSCRGLTTSSADTSAASAVSTKNCTGGEAGSIVAALTGMRNEIAALKYEQREFANSVQHYGNKIDDFGIIVNKLENALKTITTLETNVNELKRENVQLRAELSDLQQYSRINNLELTGIPETNGENVRDLVVKLGAEVDCQIAPIDIDVCHRVAHVNSENNHPRAIIVKFTTRNKKNELLGSIKKRRTLTTGDLGFQGGSGRIFAGDHLTHKNKILFKQAREFCRANNFKYCWVRDCKIFVKRMDSSRAVLVNEESVLRRLLGSARDSSGARVD